MSVTRIDVVDQALRQQLQAMIAAGRNAAPLMAAIALDLQGSVEDVLDTQGEAGGARWAALSDVQTARRSASGHWPGKILQQYGILVTSIQADSGADHAAVGTRDIRARTLHYGAARGAFGRDRHGRPLPWGAIPARPFMVLTRPAHEQIADRAGRWIMGQGL